MVMLPSLHIRGFKGFSNLRIERLGRVNLIVGKNNVGKSSLLEAIRLYAVQGAPDTLLQVLWNRDELRSWTSNKRVAVLPQDPNPTAFARLFHDCYEISDVRLPISIGPVDESGTTLTIELKREWSEKSRAGRPIIPFFHGPRWVLETRHGHEDRGKIWLDLVWDVDYRRRLRNPLGRRNEELQSIMVPPSGFGDERLGWLWDSILEADLEDAVVDALRLIDDRVERLYFVMDEFRTSDRVAVLKLKDIPGVVPLRTLGDGMSRVLGVLLAVARSRGGIALIDELENGIHYAVQPAFLKILFKVASALDVQVFATTHSWDCIAAFQEAATEDHQDGFLVRLTREDTEIKATIFDEGLLTVVTRQEIEVR